MAPCGARRLRRRFQYTHNGEDNPGYQWRGEGFVFVREFDSEGLKRKSWQIIEFPAYQGSSQGGEHPNWAPVKLCTIYGPDALPHAQILGSRLVRNYIWPSIG